jgi:hypothetical protein
MGLFEEPEVWRNRMQETAMSKGPGLVVKELPVRNSSGCLPSRILVAAVAAADHDSLPS